MRGIEALGGGPLVGGNLVYRVYLDEVGIANPDHDPHVVVLGVLVEADKQWLKIGRNLISLSDKYIRPEHRKDFVFHAKELRNGSKKMPRDSYSKVEQDKIIREVCEIPRQFGLPIVAAYVDRARLRKNKPTAKEKDLVERAQIIASATCAIMVERFMRERRGEDEGADLIFEDHPDTRKLTKELHRHLKTKTAADEARAAGFNPDKVLPLQRIPDTASFMEKTDASILQVADACAFATKRHLAGQDREGFYDSIKDNFFIGPTMIEA
jgi:Protein of unknown function (DUF3800)